MTANVRCTGQPARQVTEDGIVVERYRSCGWKGERFPHRMLSQAGVLYDRVKATAKPCPRCGGRVELIPPEAAR